METFFKNFDVFLDAPNGVQKLRELILQLAVQGKLVTQDPTDEPASVLIEKINFEKEWLVKEKKISKPKPLLPIKVDEVPYGLPKGWNWVRLGETAKVIEYGTSEKASVNDVGVPILRMNNIDAGKVMCRNLKYVSSSIKDLPRLYLCQSDILFNRTNSYELVGKSGVFKGKNKSFTFASYLIRASLFLEHVQPDLVNIAMNSGYYRKTQLEPEITQQTGQANFNGTKLANTMIPLPPLEEQKRIVAKVEQLIALCDELEARQQKRREGCVRLNNAAIVQLLTTRESDDFSKHWQRICDNFDLLYSAPENIGKLRQAILQLAVQGKLVPQDPNDEPASILLEKIKDEKERLAKEMKIERSKPLPPIEADEIPFELPDSWKWVRLGEVSVFGPKNGYSPKPVDYVTNVKSLTLSATTSGKFNGKYFKYINEKIDIDSYLWLEEGDLLIQRGNTIAYVGVAAVYKGLSHKFIYPDLMMKIRFSKYVDVAVGATN